MENVPCIILGVAVFCISVAHVGGSECCSSYYDGNNIRQEAFWCSDYCCYQYSDTQGLFYGSPIYYEDERECCSNLLHRVNYYQRQDSCSPSLWWSDHVYVAVLIGIGGLAMIVVCCVVCIKACAGSSHSSVGVVHQPPPGQVAIVMAGQPGPSMYPPQGQGYPLPGGAYPAPYGSGPPPLPTKY